MQQTAGGRVRRLRRMIDRSMSVAQMLHGHRDTVLNELPLECRRRRDDEVGAIVDRASELPREARGEVGRLLRRAPRRARPVRRRATSSAARLPCSLEGRKAVEHAGVEHALEDERVQHAVLQVVEAQQPLRLDVLHEVRDVRVVRLDDRQPHHARGRESDHPDRKRRVDVDDVRPEALERPARPTPSTGNARRVSLLEMKLKLRYRLIVHVRDHMQDRLAVLGADDEDLMTARAKKTRVRVDARDGAVDLRQVGIGEERDAHACRLCAIASRRTPRRPTCPSADRCAA